MRHKRNGALFGALLIIVGVFILFSRPYGLSLGYIPWLAAGSALLLLYYSKRATWSLALGALLFGLSLHAALISFGITALEQYAVLFFFIPGAIFMTLFLTKNRQGLLVPASVLLWAGVGLTLRKLPFLPARVSILALCLGMALITIYLLGNARISRGYLFFGAIVCLLGLYPLVKPLSFSFDSGKIGGTAIVLLGVILIVRAFRAGKNVSDEEEVVDMAIDDGEDNV